MDDASLRYIYGPRGGCACDCARARVLRREEGATIAQICEATGWQLESVDPGGRIAALIPAERVIGCVVYPACEVVAPGVIEHIEGDRFTRVGDDGACPYFWPIGDRHILIFFSHTSSGQYLLGDYDQLIKASDQMQRGQLIKRISSSVMRGGAAAFTGNVDLFMPGDAQATVVVKSTLSGIVKGIEGKEDLFTNESLELIYQSALVAVAENSTVFTDDALLSSMIKNTVTALTSKQAQAVFGQETVSAIVQAALPAGVRQFFLSVTDERGCMVTTQVGDVSP